MKSANAVVAIVRSALAKLRSIFSTMSDWIEGHAWQIAAVVFAFCSAFVGTLAINSANYSPNAPTEAVSPATIVQLVQPPANPTTITQIIQIPAPSVAHHPTEQEVVVVKMTDASQTPSQESSTTTALPSTPASASKTTAAAPSKSELPASTPSASSQPPATDAATPTSASEAP